MLGMPPDYRERAQCLRCCHPEREPVSADTLNSRLRVTAQVVPRTSFAEKNDRIRRTLTC